MMDVVGYYVDAGVPRSKLVLGLPVYGRGFVLADVNRDYPQIDDPGNYAPENLSYGAAFQQSSISLLNACCGPTTP